MPEYLPAAHRLFDRAALRRHRERAARRPGEAGFLRDAAVAGLGERLLDVNRRFAVAVDCGSGGRLAGAPDLAGRLQTAIAIDAIPTARGAGGPLLGSVLGSVVADEEFVPLAPASCDLVASTLTLHWVNDLPGALAQVAAALRPDGLFLAALLGGATLHELRHAFLEAEAAVENGASPRVSPFVDVADAGGLLQRAGFALPVVDRETLTVHYRDPLRLFADLRAMGETNALAGRRRTPLRRATLGALAETYLRRFATADGRVAATFEIIYLAGWKPDPSQRKPLRPGSAAQRLADALGTVEHDAGEKAGG